MNKKIISSILVVSLFNLVGCYSYQEIKKDNFIQTEKYSDINLLNENHRSYEQDMNDYSVREDSIFIITKDFQVYKNKEDYIESGIGSKISIEKLNGEIIEGELIFVRQNSILFLPIYQSSIKVAEYLDLIEEIKLNSLSKITVITEGDMSRTCVIVGAPTLIGFLLGYKFGPNQSIGGSTDVALIWGLIGLLIGGGLLALLTSDKVIEIDKDFDYTELIPYARFKGAEADYLKRIELD